MTTDEIDPPLRFDDHGLIPAVIQQHDSGEVLMVAWMDRDALDRTLEIGETVLYSRSRRELWHKGATSGNTQRVVELRVDCDGDTLLVLVDQLGDGVACHTGERSCFHRRLVGAPVGPAAAAPPLAAASMSTATPAPQTDDNAAPAPQTGDHIADDPAADDRAADDRLPTDDDQERAR